MGAGAMKMKIKRWSKGAAVVIVVLLAGPAFMVAWGEVQMGQAWYEADRSSAGIAPDPATTPEAVVQVYAARAFNWRGIFAVHTWVATKERNAPGYRTLQVTGWSLPALKSFSGQPDRNWFGSTPTLLKDLRGERAEAAIEGIDAALDEYPYTMQYRIWPGPKSNTFVAWLVRQVPELHVQLPPSAVGKDYLGSGVLAPTPSGTGYQISLNGVLGLAVALDEGIELNLLGLVLGVDPLGLGVKLPGVGRLALLDAWPSPSPIPPPAETVAPSQPSARSAGDDRKGAASGVVHPRRDADQALPERYRPKPPIARSPRPKSARLPGSGTWATVGVP